MVDPAWVPRMRARSKVGAMTRENCVCACVRMRMRAKALRPAHSSERLRRAGQPDSSGLEVVRSGAEPHLQHLK